MMESTNEGERQHARSKVAARLTPLTPPPPTLPQGLLMANTTNQRGNRGGAGIQTGG